MYHVISKAPSADGRHTILCGDIPGRELARQYARENQGTVKTDAELTELVNGGKIVPSATATSKETEVTTSDTTTQDADQGNTGGNPPADPPADQTIEGAAEQVANEQAKRTTVGKKAKPEPKRVKTAPEVLDRARSFMKAAAEMVKAGDLSKVDFVRQVSLWKDEPTGAKLQRSDAILLTAELVLGISPATVSTQFQFARSDRMSEYNQRADKRSQEAKEREGKKAEADKAKAAKKAERDAEKAKKEQAKKDAAAQREAEKKAKADEKAAKEKAEREAAEAKGKGNDGNSAS